jgi:hypothetical protein
MKWIFKYLKCTFILCFENSKHVLDGYTNTDIVDNGDSKKSILGYLMTFAREQFMAMEVTKYIALSTIKDEYMLLLKGLKSYYE